MSQTPADIEAASWESLGLAGPTLDLVKGAGYTKPTPIQVKAIPIVLKGGDVIASARTGSGKTASFCLPLIEKLRGRRGTYGLILCPTREIALQTQATIEQFGKPQEINSICLIGGVNLQLDLAAFKLPHHIIVGTPGRICDHLDRGNLWLEYIEMLVLDEADRMLDMGFAKELNRIVDEIPRKRQTLLFSATMPPTIERLAQKILNKPSRITIDKPLSAANSVEQRLIWVNEENKMREMLRIFEREKGTFIVFTRTKDGTFRLWRKALDFGIADATYISSNKRQQDREKALAEFKEGKHRVLFATDVAGRGIHVENVGHVINYDVPEEAEDYIHRIGRTGRKDATGIAITFATSRDRTSIRQIESLLGHPIPSVEAAGYSSQRTSSSRGGRSGGPMRGQPRGRSSAGRSSGGGGYGRSSGGSGRSSGDRDYGRSSGRSAFGRSHDAGQRSESSSRDHGGDRDRDRDENRGRSSRPSSSRSPVRSSSPRSASPRSSSSRDSSRTSSSSRAGATRPSSSRSGSSRSSSSSASRDSGRSRPASRDSRTTTASRPRRPGGNNRSR